MLHPNKEDVVHKYNGILLLLLLSHFSTLMAESEKELKILLMKVKVESGKSWLKSQHSENVEYWSG